MENIIKKNDISLVLCGAAGQGIKTVEELLTKTLKMSGFNVFATREYMSRVRGGVNSTSIRISSEKVRAFSERIDFLFPLNDSAIPHLKDKLNPDSVIIGEKNFIEQDSDAPGVRIEVPFLEISKDVGGKVYANIVVLGLICNLLNADKAILHNLLEENFSSKGTEVVQNNIKATDKGFEKATQLIDEGKLTRVISIKTNEDVINDYIIDGTQAIALGAIAGGVNYVTFYPMAPSTGIGTFLAQQGTEFSIIVDQSEDEISVINKALGASYAGARALVSTSGGGFSLMGEGVSLTGMSELPLVIIVGQRPGPATGMPTRTAQEDLNLVLHAGAGYFPRMIFAPNSIEEAYLLTQNAFNLTQEYQVPVFILTDQYLVDSYYNIKKIEYETLKRKNFIIKTERDYERYKFTASGISPRGIPGYGVGLVDADSHTHTEVGDITEDPELRIQTVKKRLKKFALIKDNALAPEYFGSNDIKYLIISWGSSFYLIKEALEILNRSDVGFLHFKQVYPLNEVTNNYVSKAEKIIVIESNPTAQFGNLIELETHRKTDHVILKYSGYTFSVEEILDRIKKVIEGI
ncbi:MAG: 2-oxoacid:acceptor oxidoreductase subunit alpha [Candidatus Thorarchaeota archaeon]